MKINSVLRSPRLSLITDTAGILIAAVCNGQYKITVFLSVLSMHD